MSEQVDIHEPLAMHPDIDPNAGVELAVPPVKSKVSTLPAPAPQPQPKAKKMNPPSVVYIVNKSTAAGLAAVLPAIVAACEKQLARDVAPIWGAVPALELVAAGASPPKGECVFTIQDTLDVAGALGYHDEESGVALGFIGTTVTLENGGTTSEGANSISVTLSHELIELVGDVSANLWADAPDGSDYARELCDAVEDGSYEVDGIAVSNFLYPAFFDGQATGDERLDQMGALKKPFAMTSGGYQIKRTEPGKVAQVWGSIVKIVAHDKGRALHAVFGPTFPTWKVAGKIAKLRAKRTPKAKKAA